MTLFLLALAWLLVYGLRVEARRRSARRHCCCHGRYRR